MFYLDILPTKFTLNKSELDSEIRLLKHLPKKQLIKLQTTNCNKSIRYWLSWFSSMQTRQMYSNVYKALSLNVTIPVTSCSCGRSFSKMSFVKTKLRSHKIGSIRLY